MIRKLPYIQFLEKKLLPFVSNGCKSEINETLEQHSKIYIDGTEQSIRRPKNKVEQRDNYSGKKKDHTSKVLIISGEDKSIEVMTPVYVGSSHDFSILKEEGLTDVLPLKTPIYVDTGFEGIDGINENLNIRKPKKKPRKRKLNGGEKRGNRIISSERVKVEHAIGGLKKFKIAATIFRGISSSMETSIQIACGLWNFHIRKTKETLCRIGS